MRLALALLVSSCGTAQPPPPRASHARAAARNDGPRIAGRPRFTVQGGHRGPALTVDWSPDGALLASGSADRSVIVRDARTGEVRTTLWGHRDGVRDVAIRPDGAVLASAGSDGAILLWDLTNGRTIATIRPPEGLVFAIAWSPDGSRLASAGHGVRLWDATGTEHGVFGEAGGALASVVWSPSGRAIAAARDDGKALVWDVASGSLVELDGGGGAPVKSVAWSPDGTRLAVGEGARMDEGEGAVRIWDVATSRAVGMLRPVGADPTSVAWSPDGRSIATSDGLSARIWNPATGTVRATVTEIGGPTELRWSPDGRSLVAGQWDGGVSIWDERANRVRTFAPETAGGSVVAWSDDGGSIATGHWDGSVVVWDVRSGRMRAALAGHDSRVLDVRFGPDGTLLTAGKTELRIWELGTSRMRSEIALPPDVLSIAWSPDGSKAAAGTETGPIRIWDARGRALRTLRRHEARVIGLAWSPDSRLLASASGDGAVEIWDVASGRSLRTLGGHAGGAFAVSWSADGTALATAAVDGSVRIFDARTGDPRIAIPAGDDTVFGVAWTPDGRAISTTGWRGDLHLYDAATGVPRATLPAHEGALSAHAWNPGGSVAATLGAGLRLHRLSDGATILLERFDREDRILALAHTEDGLFTGDDEAFERVLFTVGEDLRTAEILSADQLFEAFHRPSLVQDFLDGAPLEPPAEAASGIGLPPAVEMEPPPEDAPADAIRIQVRASDRGGGVAEIRVFVNGARVRDEGRGGGFAVPSSRGLWDGEVQLSPGENEIVAEAYGAVGRVRSRRLSVRTRRPQSGDERPDLHLFAITLDQYDDPSQALSFANADGDAIVAALQAQEGRLYGHVRVTRLRDREATRDGIETAAAALAESARPADVVVFYAAGHGTLVRCDGEPAARYHLLTWRASLRSDASVCREGLDDGDLATLLRAVPARKKLLLLDTCQAGAAATAETLTAMRGAEEIDVIKRLARAEGLAVIAAAKATEYAGEVRELGHGLFTYAVLEGLGGRAARTGGRTVSVFGLLGYLEESVAELSRRYFARSQYPITSTQGQDFPIALLEAPAAP